MKKLRVVLAIVLPVLIALLVVFFVCTIKIGNFIDSSDINDAVGALFTVLLTAIPTFCFPVLAGVLLILWICLLAVESKWGTAIALLVFLTVFLPVLAFTLFVNGAGIATGSPVLLTVVLATGVVYGLSFLLTVIYVALLRRARKYGLSEE